MTEESSLHTGHRQRMREKLLSYGSDVMQSHELLEMLLYYVIPYKNTNPIAKRLILEFGNLENVFSASKEELCRVNGVGEGIAEFLKAVADFIGEKNKTAEAVTFDDYSLVGEFLVDKLSSEKTSKTAALLFDNKMRLLSFSVISEHDYSSAAVKPQAFVDKAIKLRAAVVVTAHTHPYGPLFPTAGDMATNISISSALSLAGITHLEHYIISGKKYMGISNKLSISFLQSPELDRFYRSREKILGE